MARLHKLVPEVFELVAKAASNRALLSLRLTSRDCAAKVLKTYAQTYFSEITLHIHDDASIAKCLKICNDPDFGPVVRSLVIVVDECEREEDSHWTQRWCTVDHRHTTRGATLQRGLEMDTSIETWLGQYDDWAELHVVFNELARLCKGLSKVRVLGRTVRAKRLLRVELDDPWDEWVCASTVICIMRCLDHSHLRLSRLELGTEDETDEVWTLPITELTANDIQLFTWVLSSMQSVKLSLWASMPTDGVSRHAISDKEPLMMLLRGLEASATLKHLSVNFRHGRVWNSTYIGLDRLHFPQLESLRWSGSYAMHFELTELANFITTHRPTLKHFELGLARVVNEGCIVSKKLFEKGIACNLRKFTGAGDIVVSADTEQDWLWCNVPPDQD